MQIRVRLVLAESATKAILLFELIEKFRCWHLSGAAVTVHSVMSNLPIRTLPISNDDSFRLALWPVDTYCKCSWRHRWRLVSILRLMGWAVVSRHVSDVIFRLFLWFGTHFWGTRISVAIARWTNLWSRDIFHLKKLREGFDESPCLVENIEAWWVAISRIAKISRRQSSLREVQLFFYFF